MDGKASEHKNSAPAAGSPPDVAVTMRASFAALSLARLRQDEAPRLALWTPAAIGLGVALALLQTEALRAEALALTACLVAACGVGAAFLRRFGGAAAAVARVGMIAAALCACGVLAVEMRMAGVDAPVWPQAQRGERGVSGRVLALTRSGSGALKLRLDRLEIEGAPPGATPERAEIRILAPASEGAAMLALTGRRVGLRARLFPPPGPAEPGAFDFRRRAFFSRLGALGVQGRGEAARLRDLGQAQARGALDRLATDVASLRAHLSARARAAAPGVEGAVIAALLVGDRSGLPEATLTSLRDSNLAHLLAISGLHMAMVCLTVFAALRIAFALPSWRPFGLSGKKAAAFCAILAGGAYLQLSGGGAPPERAYVMIACAFGAMLADRPAVTLRAVALAATLLLLLRPESLFDPGFQLSFAATTAMVAVFEVSRPVWRRDRAWSLGRNVALWGAALIVSSLTAGLATAPFAALIFNRVSRFGLAANLAAVPAMGLWIMPLGVAALALTPFGLDGPLYALMALGVSYVLAVAETISSWPGARIPVAVGPPHSAALFALAGLCFCLWRSPVLKLLGLAPLLVGLTLWRGEQRPDLIIAREGRLLGVLTTEGRAFDRDPRRAQTYSAELWLRRDGDGASLDDAAARRAFRGRRGVREARLPGGWRVLRFAPRHGTWEAAARQCRPRVVLVAPRFVAPTPQSDGAPFKRPPGGCLLLDRAVLRTHGAVALWAPEAPDRAPRWTSVAGRSSDRPWARR